MKQMLFETAFKRPVNVFFYEKGRGWEKIKTTITYDKDNKKWFLKIKKDKIPCPENIFDLITCNTLILLRVGPNEYRFVNLKVLGERQEPEIYRIPPDELYEAIKRAEMRRERMKSFWERFMPIILLVIAFIAIGIFIAIVWSSTGEKITKISENFAEAMKVLQNITETQTQLIKSIKAGEVLVSR